MRRKQTIKDIRELEEEILYLTKKINTLEIRQHHLDVEIEELKNSLQKDYKVERSRLTDEEWTELCYQQNQADDDEELRGFGDLEYQMKVHNKNK